MNGNHGARLDEVYIGCGNLYLRRKLLGLNVSG
jgi:hypothetical protein